MFPYTLKHIHGNEIEGYLDDLIRIRTTVFHEWPYLYEGSREYEMAYLSRYLVNPRALCILVLKDDDVVGISTLMPLKDEYDELKGPVADAGFDVDKIFYFSESCMMPGHRGSGLYPEIFRRREDHVRSFGLDYDKICFCSVVRPTDHPSRPEVYRPLYETWRRMGFERLDGLQMSFEWTDVGEEAETSKFLDVWMKDIG